MMENRLNEVKQRLKAAHEEAVRLIVKAPANILVKAPANIFTERSVASHTFIAGGAVASLFIGEEPRDFDVYIDEKNVANILHTQLRNSSQDFKYGPHSLNFTNNIQLIEPHFAGTPEEVINGFDFAHCKCYYTLSGLHIDNQAAKSILTRQLEYLGSKNPISALFRINKFIKRGWTISQEEYMKVIVDVTLCDLTDRKQIGRFFPFLDYEKKQVIIEKVKNYKNRQALEELATIDLEGKMGTS